METPWFTWTVLRRRSGRTESNDWRTLTQLDGSWAYAGTIYALFIYVCR